MTRQLVLPFTHEPSYHPDEFVPDPTNEHALAWLRTDWPDGRLAVWGPAGVGKTHLLHVWQERRDAAILRGPTLREWPELPYGDGIAVDDADGAPEHALLHLLNSAAEDSRPVLLTARTAPSRWPTRLPDLASRLRAVPAVEVAAPGEDMLALLFANLLAARQMAVPAPLQHWMRLRLPRDPAILREAAARLDRAALQAGGRATQAVAAGVVAELGNG